MKNKMQIKIPSREVEFSFHELSDKKYGFFKISFIFALSKKGESCEIHELSRNRDLLIKQKVGSPKTFAI